MSIYKCAEMQLYTVCRAAWNNCKRQLPDFYRFKKKYTVAYIDTRLAEIETTSQIPDLEARQGESKVSHIHVVQKAQDCTNVFKRLKRYIIAAFPKELHKTYIKTAGHPYYSSACNKNWKSVNAINTNVEAFITKHLSELLANDNMPDTFPSEALNIHNDFKNTLANFYNTVLNSRTDTQEKTIANNKIHSQLMEMLLDGQLIYEKDEALKKQFIFAHLLFFSKGVGTSGISGLITDDTTQLPIPDVKITILQKQRDTLSLPNGKYYLRQVGEGLYTVILEKENYQTLTIQNFKIKKGTMSRLKLAMIPI